MSSFQEFKEKFEQDFPDGIYEFINENEDKVEGIPYEGKLILDGDEETYDSYGSEDSSLRRVYQFGDIYVEFTGTRQSYSGEEWTGMKEVFLTTKTIEVFI